MDTLNLGAAQASQATMEHTGAVVPREAHKGGYHYWAKEKHGCCFQRGLVMKEAGWELNANPHGITLMDPNVVRT